MGQDILIFVNGFALAHLCAGMLLVWQALPGIVANNPVRNVPFWIWMLLAVIAVLIWPYFLMKAAASK